MVCIEPWYYECPMAIPTSIATRKPALLAGAEPAQISQDPNSACWPPTIVLAMNVHLITCPEMSVQDWFEEQVSALG
ncbi:MAG: hypothetical protein ACKVY0_16230 [Prosthecobacter sp.]|uniref:hypothetical protein n=1 Tax=Prosthecobacter sp. TaxID=1965333 RepID=UPI0038FDE62A